MNLPDTRASLILRLPDVDDVAAWDEFLAIYQPLIYRLAVARGLQHADALDLVQEVLLAVSRSVDRWSPDPQRGRFRDWLFRIARNLMINFLTRRRHKPLGSGDTAVAELIDIEASDAVSDTADETQVFDREYRREVFRWAAEQVRQKVRPNTWQAFWLSSVQGVGIEEVAQRLGMTVGGVYVARSRVIARLRRKSENFDRRKVETRNGSALDAKDRP